MKKYEHYETEGEDWFTYPTLYKNMVERFGDFSRFVEVGVWKGRSITFLAVEVANSGKKIKIYAVDPWDGTATENDPSNINNIPELQKDPEWLYNIFLKNIKPVKKFIEPLRMLSLDAVKTFEDESLDFVFIDAFHDYENVKADILAWLPKIKKTGVIAGHDYNGEIKMAVNEVLGEKNLVFPDLYCWMYDLKDHQND